MPRTVKLVFELLEQRDGFWAFVGDYSTNELAEAAAAKLSGKTSIAKRLR